MKLKSKLLSILLCLSLFVVPVNTVCATTETPVTTDEPVSNVSKITYYDLDGVVVNELTPYIYTKASQLENPKYNTYQVKVPLGYEDDAILPMKVKSKGALIYALAAGYSSDYSLSYYLYSDAECTDSISTNDNIAYVPKAGTYYIKISKYTLSEEQDSIISGAFAFISGESVQLKNKSSVVSAIVDYEKPVYYKIVVKKATKLSFTIVADSGITVTLCNSKKNAITNDEYLYSSDVEEGAKTLYVVGKGTYYLKLKGSQGAVAISSTFSTVSSASGVSKSKAGTLKVNGKTRSILVFPDDSTKKNYYVKFYNPKRQKIYVNLTTNYTSGKMEFEFLDASNDSFGTSTLYDGLNQKNSYYPYTSSFTSSSKTLDKGTYYIKFKKLDKKTSGMIQVNINTKSK